MWRIRSSVAASRPRAFTPRPIDDRGLSKTYSAPCAAANSHSSRYSSSSASEFGVHSRPCSNSARARARTVATVVAKLPWLPRNLPCDSGRNPSRDTLQCTPPICCSSPICRPSNVVALVQTPTCIPAWRNARTTSRKRGWIVGSPPVSVTRSTRHSASRGISTSVICSKSIVAPSRVAETKQCAQCKLQRSSICTNAFRRSPSVVVRK